MSEPAECTNGGRRVCTDQRLLYDDDLSLRTDHSKFTDTVLTDNGYIEGKELDDFFRHMMKRLGPQVSQHTCDSWLTWRQQLGMNGTPAAVCMGGATAQNDSSNHDEEPSSSQRSHQCCLLFVSGPTSLDTNGDVKQTEISLSLSCLLLSINGPKTSTGLCFWLLWHRCDRNKSILTSVLLSQTDLKQITLWCRINKFML